MSRPILSVAFTSTKDDSTRLGFGITDALMTPPPPPLTGSHVTAKKGGGERSVVTGLGAVLPTF